MGFSLPSIFNTKPVKELISVAIVDENGKEYFAVCNEFNLKEAWDREFIQEEYPSRNPLIGLWPYLLNKKRGRPDPSDDIRSWEEMSRSNKYWLFKKMLDEYGKPMEQIAKEVAQIINSPEFKRQGGGVHSFFYQDTKSGLGMLLEDVPFIMGSKRVAYFKDLNERKITHSLLIARKLYQYHIHQVTKKVKSL